MGAGKERYLFPLKGFPDSFADEGLIVHKAERLRMTRSICSTS
jgi:hypothetical protein